MSNKYTLAESQNEPDHYEIRLKGHLADRWTAWFDGLTITLEERGETLHSEVEQESDEEAHDHGERR